MKTNIYTIVGEASDMAAGMKLAQELLVSGAVSEQLERIRKCLNCD